MNSTKVPTILAASAAMLLALTLAGCGGDSGTEAAGGDQAGSTKKAADPANAADSGSGGKSAAELGKTFCTAIKSVQADLRPDAKSAAYLAQLVLKLDPAENAKLSAAVVDKATKKECPAEYAKILEQAEITSLRDVGLQP